MNMNCNCKLHILDHHTLLHENITGVKDSKPIPPRKKY